MGRWERLYFRVVNALLVVVLRSRLHGVRSGSVALLEFYGRLSGRRYRIPVGYWLITPNEVVCLTSAVWSRWWVNLDGAQITIWLAGRALSGHAVLVREPSRRRELVPRFFLHNPGHLHHYGVNDRRGDVQALNEELLVLADTPDTKVILITIGPGTP